MVIVTLHMKTSQRVTNVNITWCLLRQTNSTNCCLSMKFCSYNKGATSSGALLHFLHYLGECVSKWFKTAHLGHPLLLKIHVCVWDHPVPTCPTMLLKQIELVCSSGKHVVWTTSLISQVPEKSMLALQTEGRFAHQLELRGAYSLPAC